MTKKFLILFFLNANFIFCQKKIEIFYDFNKSDLSEIAKIKIDSLLSHTQFIKFSKIQSYCDTIDSNKYNKILSENRTLSVLEYLKSKKAVINSNIEMNSIGEDFKQSKVQSKNRKSEIYFFEYELKDIIKLAKKGDKIKLKNINFYNQSSEILPNSKTSLFQLLTIMKQNQRLKIEIQGHICCNPPYFVEKISEARAKTVYTYLIDNNIDKNRLKYKGYGATNPIYKIPENNEFEQIENRRVELLITEN